MNNINRHRLLFGFTAALVALSLNVETSSRGGLTVSVGVQQARASVFDDISNALNKIGSLGKQIAEFTTGEMAKLISAFKSGPEGLMKYVLEKIPGAGKIIEAFMFGGGSLADRLKRAGETLLSELKSLVDGAINAIKTGFNNTLAPIITKAKEFITEKVLKPALDGLTNLISGEIDHIAEKVASMILAKTDRAQGMIDSVAGALDSVASGDFSAVDKKLAGYNTSLDTIGQDAVNMAIEYGLEWLRGKIVPFVMTNVHKLLKMVWDWAYKGVAIARNAIQGLVGSIPFAGAALAPIVGGLIDEGWKLLKGKVEDFVDTQINSLADMAMGAAKNFLAGPASKAGGIIQSLVEMIKGPLQTIATKVKAKVDPIMAQYRNVIASLKKVRDKKGLTGAVRTR